MTKNTYKILLGMVCFKKEKERRRKQKKKRHAVHYLQ